MMSAPNLFFSQEEKKYFWTGLDTCAKCKKIVSLQGLLVWHYWSTTFSENLYCANCKEQAKRTTGKYVELRPVLIGFMESLPEDVIAIWPSKPQLANGMGNVFDVAIQKMEGKVNDNTKLSAKQLLGGRKDPLMLEKEVSIYYLFGSFGVMLPHQNTQKEH